MANRRPIVRGDQSLEPVTTTPSAGGDDEYTRELKQRKLEMAHARVQEQNFLNDPNRKARKAAGLPDAMPPVNVWGFSLRPDPTEIKNADGTSICPPGYRQAHVPRTNIMDGSPGDGNMNTFVSMGFVPAKWSDCAENGDRAGQEVIDTQQNIVMICPNGKLIDYMSAANPNMVDDGTFHQAKYASLQGIADTFRGGVRAEVTDDYSREMDRPYSDGAPA